MANKIYVMYGYKLSDEDMTAYFGEDLQLVTELSAARRFPSKKARGQKSFGTPQQWVNLINEDSELNQGYKFHLVLVIS